MMFTIELTDEQIAALKAKAATEGLSLEGWLRKIANEEAEPRQKPYKTGYGMLAKYGPAPSAEEIDENRRDMFRGFGEDF
jgi:plasmid stability protein